MRESHRMAIRVVLRMKYFVAKKKFQVRSNTFVTHTVHYDFTSSICCSRLLFSLPPLPPPIFPAFTAFQPLFSSLPCCPFTPTGLEQDATGQKHTQSVCHASLPHDTSDAAVLPCRQELERPRSQITDFFFWSLFAASTQAL